MKITITITLPQTFGKLVLQKAAENVRRTVSYIFKTDYNIGNPDIVAETQE